jgi:hypothetical protein
MKHFRLALSCLISSLTLATGAGAQVSTIAQNHGMADTNMSYTQCLTVPTSDQLTAAGAFASSCSVPKGLVVGTVIEVRFHGYFSTSSAGTLALQVDAGGTAGICPASSNFTLAASTTNGYFDGECKIIIASTGSSGTADAYGWYEKAAANGSSPVQATFSNAGTLPTYNTTVAENVAIEASTFTGTSINRQSVYVKITHP